MKRFINSTHSATRRIRVVCGLLSFMLLISCSFSSQTFFAETDDILNDIEEDLDTLEEIQDEISENSKSHVLFDIRSSKKFEPNPSMLYMDKIDDVIYISLGNYSPTEDFILKLFLDCEEAEFIVNEVQTDGYVFSLENGKRETFEIRLVTDKDMSTTHDFVAAVFFGPETHISDLNTTDNRYGCVSHKILSNSDSLPHEQPLQNEPEEYLDVQYQGIVIGTQIDYKMKEVFLPPCEITVKSGEMVRLSYRAGRYDQGIDNMSVVLMLDWKPIRFQDSDYFCIKNEPDKLSYGVIEFSAPTESGRYDLTSFVIPDPFGDKWLMSCELGYRITLIVE